jgi:hypothetical protein
MSEGGGWIESNACSKQKRDKSSPTQHDATPNRQPTESVQHDAHPNPHPHPITHRRVSNGNKLLNNLHCRSNVSRSCYSDR